MVEGSIRRGHGSPEKPHFVYAVPISSTIAGFSTPNPAWLRETGEQESGGGGRRRRAEEESGRRRRGVRNHFTPTRNVAAQPTPSERVEEQERVRERERTCSSVYAVSIRLELLATATLNVKRRRGAIHFPNHSLHIPDIESNPRAPLPAYAPRVYDGLAVAASPVAARAPDPVPAMTAVHMTPKHFFFININILSAKKTKHCILKLK